MSIQIEKDLRARLSPGVYAMFVGAPISPDGTAVETYTSSPMGVDGWLSAALVEGRWIVSLDGIVTRDPLAEGYRTRLGEFENEGQYESAQVAAFSECPRIDYLADDGGRADWASAPDGVSRVVDAGP